MADSICNAEDTIDSRDVIERIEDLESTLLPWRAKMCDYAGIDREEDFATHEEATEALAEWLDDHAEYYTEAETQAEDFTNAAIDIRALADGATHDGGVGDTAFNITIEKIDVDAADADELAALKALAAEVEGYVSDWNHGATLIRESYFTQYAEELASDIGAISRDAQWPLMHIDWEAAAEALKIDYTEVTFDGVSYYVR